MANTFMDLTTDSSGEKRDWQSNRSKDGFEKVTIGSHATSAPNRWDLAEVAGADTKGVDMPTGPSPNLKPKL